MLEPDITNKEDIKERNLPQSESDRDETGDRSTELYNNANNTAHEAQIESTESDENWLGLYIRKTRVARRMSQDELARAVGKSGAWISKVENSVHRHLSPASYRALAHALGLNLNDLMKMGGYRSAEETVEIRHPAADFFLRFPEDITPEEVDELCLFLEVSREMKKRRQL